MDHQNCTKPDWNFFREGDYIVGLCRCGYKTYTLDTKRIKEQQKWDRVLDKSKIWFWLIASILFLYSLRNDTKAAGIAFVAGMLVYFYYSVRDREPS